AQSGSTHRTLVTDVLHHWLAATAIPKPLKSAIPATHMPSPFRKLASLGPSRRTKPSPPASHAHPARTRRRDVLPVIASSIVSPRPSSWQQSREEQKTHDRATSWRRAPILRLFLPDGWRRASGMAF